MRVLIAFSLLFLVAPVVASPYDASPWLADLAQFRTALETRYANYDWVVHERDIDLDQLFGDASDRLRATHSEDGARAVFDRLLDRIHDGHLEIDWPAHTPIRSETAGAPNPAPLCERLGYDARQTSNPGLALHLQGYEPLASERENALAAGLLIAGGERLGIVRIGVFQPQGYPALCHAAAAALALSDAAPCDERCEELISAWAYRRLNHDLSGRLRALKQAGASSLLVDLTHNGGGTEWAEAAARMVTARQLRAAPLRFVRSKAWAKQWADLANDLRAAAGKATTDKLALLGLAAEADRAAAAAKQVCDGHACPRLAEGGYATGLVPAAAADAFHGEPWGDKVFSPAKFNSQDGIWSGPLVVLVDGETWSAAEEFAAELQDNGAAIVLGARSGGAGCGHASPALPLVLAYSRASLSIPDCARLRSDGSNEVNGVIPDVPVAFRAEDSPAFSARLIAARLPEAIAQAKQLARRPSPPVRDWTLAAPPR